MSIFLLVWPSFKIILNVICLFHCVDICTRGTKTKVDKTAGTWTGIKTVASKCTRIIVFFITTYWGGGAKASLSLMKRLKLLIKSQHLNMCLFNIPYIKMGNIHKVKHFCCIQKYDLGLQEKHLCYWAAGWTSYFFLGNIIFTYSTWFIFTYKTFTNV